MALQSSGRISLNDVNVELGNSGTAQIDMNSSAVRDLFGIASGEIAMDDGYGADAASYSAIAAAGGTVTTSGNYKYHTFTTSGTFQITDAPAGESIEYVIVAGGGGGGGGANGNGSGGGGAGGMQEITTSSVSTGTYSIIIGGGGAGSNDSTLRGNQGSGSSALGNSSNGGGGRRRSVRGD